MANSLEVIDELLARAPSLTSLYQGHLSDNDELLPHVLFGGLARFVAELCATDPSSKDLRAILDVIEKGMAHGDANTQELISVSFLENLDQKSDYFPVLTGMFGEALTRELQKYR